jgi:predicted RNA binding protein YcfA (HicA-like mRNA interferase family)
MLEAKGHRLDRISGSHPVFEKPGCHHQSVPVHGGKVKVHYVDTVAALQG